MPPHIFLNIAYIISLHVISRENWQNYAGLWQGSGSNKNMRILSLRVEHSLKSVGPLGTLGRTLVKMHWNSRKNPLELSDLDIFWRVEKRSEFPLARLFSAPSAHT